MVLIYVNSLTDREQRDSTSQWTTYLVNPIDIPHDRVAKLAVLSVEIPYTATQFKRSNSVFWLEEITEQRPNADLTPDDTPWLTTSQRAVGVEIDFNQFFLTVQAVVDAVNEKLALQNIQCKLTYNSEGTRRRIGIENTSTISKGTSFDTRIKYRPVSSKEYESKYTHTMVLNGVNIGSGGVDGSFFNLMNVKLGIIGDTNTTFAGPGQTAFASGIPRIIRTNCFYITSDATQMEASFPSPYNNVNILCKVPITSNFGTVQTMHYTNPQYIELNDSSLDKIEFSIVDDEYEPVELFGAPTTLVLDLQIE